MCNVTDKIAINERYHMVHYFKGILFSSNYTDAGSDTGYRPRKL